MSEAARKLSEILHRAQAQAEVVPRTDAEQAKFAAQLQSLESRMREARHAFEPGQLLQWKPGLDNRLCPGPFVFTRYDYDVTSNEESAGNPGFREPLDAVVGYIDENPRNSDATYIELHMDSRRLEPYTGVTLETLVEAVPEGVTN